MQLLIFVLLIYFSSGFCECPFKFSPLQSNPNKCVAIIYTSYYTYTDALAACQNVTSSSTLLSIENEAENIEILTLKDYDVAWIGLVWNNQTNTAFWLDGSPVNYTNFPNPIACGFNGNYNGYYISKIYYNDQLNGYWYNCTTSAYALCEYRLDHIKQSGHSGKSSNNSAFLIFTFLFSIILKHVV